MQLPPFTVNQENNIQHAFMKSKGSLSLRKMVHEESCRFANCDTTKIADLACLEDFVIHLSFFMTVTVGGGVGMPGYYV